MSLNNVDRLGWFLAMLYTGKVYSPYQLDLGLVYVVRNQNDPLLNVSHNSFLKRVLTGLAYTSPISVLWNYCNYEEKLSFPFIEPFFRRVNSEVRPKEVRIRRPRKGVR